jgi:hypothetical protein
VLDGALIEDTISTIAKCQCDGMRLYSASYWHSRQFLPPEAIDSKTSCRNVLASTHAASFELGGDIAKWTNYFIAAKRLQHFFRSVFGDWITWLSKASSSPVALDAGSLSMQSSSSSLRRVTGHSFELDTLCRALGGPTPDPVIASPNSPHSGLRNRREPAQGSAVVRLSRHPNASPHLVTSVIRKWFSRYGAITSDS